MIIALGYRVQSQVATRFRRWATQRLHEYIQKDIRAVYYIVSTRTITGKKAKQDEVIDANVTDLRLAFELEFSHKLSDDIQMIKTEGMISYTFIDTTFDSIEYLMK